MIKFLTYFLVAVLVVFLLIGLAAMIVLFIDFLREFGWLKGKGRGRWRD